MEYSHLKKKKRRWPYILFAVVAAILIFGFVGYRFVRQLTPEQILGSGLFQSGIVKYVGEENRDIVNLIPQFLGFDEPRTYLVMFLNNTELRPGGGFIGVYGVIRVNKGQTEVVVVEGTEALDKKTPANWKPTAPLPITEHLGVDRWYFRDSNWSPDFIESAKKGLEFYTAEGGVSADEIDAVIGVTPTVLEELMKITGSFTIEGIEFTSDNVIETLEYEVEYGYEKRGTSFADRKAIIKPFMFALLDHMKENLFGRLEEYAGVIEDLAEQKQVVVYSLQENFQKTVADRDWSGVVHEVSGDYLMWVDANLGALKTDHAVDRDLSYTIHKRDDGKYVASATMTYTHNGKFDWRTTRYRTYARVFVPNGSELIGAGILEKEDSARQRLLADFGKELGKEWFGGFISIEPGNIRTLTFEYVLPSYIEEQIADEEYTLFVQKQIGTIAPGLTVDINFDKTIKQAEPVEPQEAWGDSQYSIDTDLRVDRAFRVSL